MIKSNWIVNIEHMIMVNIAKMRVHDIAYVEEVDVLFYHWKNGKHEGWDECVLEVKDEYLRQRDIEVDRIILEETDSIIV